ncbi:hypothetical protein [Litoribrevibacter albus]|uniref:Uncharacterized protein n=1 Tax=Litoribrevibacter albus TaxID=1473156 RepID=A0AA37S6I9_9GAMM|nr:hypothetical protein [Litoribrevibacter albus]GLQ29615.1 hypothetical protein GCM10007876_00930 [Litoribrevibacter albus]
MENLDATLDQMVDHILNYNEIEFLDLVQFIWRRGWALENAEPPHDELELRCALKACLIERMAEIWNAPPKNSNEVIPAWCLKIPALSNSFSVIKPEEQSLWEGESGNDIFRKRNIFAPSEFMFFL